jgi:hypothetical protein
MLHIARHAGRLVAARLFALVHAGDQNKTPPQPASTRAPTPGRPCAATSESGCRSTTPPRPPCAPAWSRRWTLRGCGTFTGWRPSGTSPTARKPSGASCTWTPRSRRSPSPTAQVGPSGAGCVGPCQAGSCSCCCAQQPCHSASAEPPPPPPHPHPPPTHPPTPHPLLPLLSCTAGAAGQASARAWAGQDRREPFWPPRLTRPADTAAATCALHGELLPALKRQSAFLHQVRGRGRRVQEGSGALGQLGRAALLPWSRSRQLRRRVRLVPAPPPPAAAASRRVRPPPGPARPPPRCPRPLPLPARRSCAAPTSITPSSRAGCSATCSSCRWRATAPAPSWCGFLGRSWG